MVRQVVGTRSIHGASEHFKNLEDIFFSSKTSLECELELCCNNCYEPSSLLSMETGNTTSRFFYSSSVQYVHAVVEAFNA